jgi:hypothetical protein
VRHVVEKGAPSLRRRLAGAHHVFGNRGSGEHQAQLEEFSMNSRRSPKGIGQAHASNELTRLFRQFRPSRVPKGQDLQLQTGASPEGAGKGPKE